jgi:anti-sigma regulatory factor (Ser/Thr protein kinase)
VTPRVWLLLDARPDAPDIVVRALGEWSRSVGWPPAEARELLFAVREAVCNSVAHAYRDEPAGRIAVDAVVRHDARHGDHIDLTVSDTGSWRPRSDTTRPGYGIPLMRAATARLVISTGTSGTQVHLRSRAMSRAAPTFRGVTPITALRRCEDAPGR